MSIDISKQFERLLNRFPDQFLIVQRSDNHEVIVCLPKINEAGRLVNVETIAVNLATPNLDRVYVKPKVLDYCRICIKEKKVRKRVMYELSMPEAMPKRKIFAFVSDSGEVVAQSVMDGKLNIVQRIFVEVTLIPGTRKPMAIDRIDLIGYDEVTGDTVKEEIQKPPLKTVIELAKS